MNSFSEYLTKPVDSNLPISQEKSLEDNVSVLNKNFCPRNEIINKLVETQNTVLNTIMANSKIQDWNTLNFKKLHPI